MYQRPRWCLPYTFAGPTVLNVLLSTPKLHLLWSSTLHNVVRCWWGVHPDLVTLSVKYSRSPAWHRPCLSLARHFSLCQEQMGLPYREVPEPGKEHVPESCCLSSRATVMEGMMLPPLRQSPALCCYNGQEKNDPFISQNRPISPSINGHSRGW